MTEQTELSERELEILRLVATGASNKEIAQQLYISPNTVKVHLKNIFSKIGAASRTEAAMYVVQQGLFQPEAAAGTEAQPLPESGPGPQAERSARPWGVVAGWGVAAALLLFALVAFLLIQGQRNPPSTPASQATTEAPRWNERASLPDPRAGMAVVIYNEQVYAVAGEGAAGVSGAVERYDPESDRWEALSPKPLPVADVSAAVLGGKIYLPGGRTEGGEVTERMEIYDPLEDRWMEGPSLPAPVSAYALAVFEGKLFLFGGWDGAAYLDSVYEYDPGQERWVERAPMPTARAFAGAATAGRTIYVIGGLSEAGPLAVNEAYQPDLAEAGQGPWLERAALPQPRYAFGIDSIAGALPVLGGKGEGLEESPALLYSPDTDEWQQLTPPPEPVGYGLRLAASGPYLYLLGGKVESPAGDTLSGELYVYRAFYTLSFPVIEK